MIQAKNFVSLSRSQIDTPIKYKERERKRERERERVSKWQIKGMGNEGKYLYAQARIILPVHVQGVRDYPTSWASNFSWSLENPLVISRPLGALTYGAATKGFSKFLSSDKEQSLSRDISADTSTLMNSEIRSWPKSTSRQGRLCSIAARKAPTIFHVLLTCQFTYENKSMQE